MLSLQDEWVERQAREVARIQAWAERVRPKLVESERAVFEALVEFECAGTPKVTHKDRTAFVWWPRSRPSLAHEQAYRDAVRRFPRVKLVGLASLSHLPRLQVGLKWLVRGQGRSLWDRAPVRQLAEVVAAGVPKEPEWPAGSKHTWITWDAWTWVKLGWLRGRPRKFLEALEVPVTPPGSKSSFKPNEDLAWLLPWVRPCSPEEAKRVRAEWVAGRAEPGWLKHRKLQPGRTWLTGWELAQSELADSESVFVCIKGWSLRDVPPKYLRWLVWDRTLNKRTNKLKDGTECRTRLKEYEHRLSDRTVGNELWRNARWLLEQAEGQPEWVQDSTGQWVQPVPRFDEDEDRELEGNSTGHWGRQSVRVTGWVELPSGLKVERIVQQWVDSGTSRPLGKWGADSIQRHQVRLTELFRVDEDPVPLDWHTVGFSPRSQRNSLRSEFVRGEVWTEHGRAPVLQDFRPPWHEDQAPRDWEAAWRRLWLVWLQGEGLLGRLKVLREQGRLRALRARQVSPEEQCWLEAERAELETRWQACRAEGEVCRQALVSFKAPEPESMGSVRSLLKSLRDVLKRSEVLLRTLPNWTSRWQPPVNWVRSEIRPVRVRQVREFQPRPGETWPVEERVKDRKEVKQLQRRVLQALAGYLDADEEGVCSWSRRQRLTDARVEWNTLWSQPLPVGAEGVAQ